MLDLLVFVPCQLAALCLVLALAGLAGHSVLSVLRRAPDPAAPALDTAVIATVLGLGLVSHAVMLLGLCGMLTRGWVAAATLALIAINLRSCRAGLARVAAARRWLPAVLLLAAPFVLLALYPPTGLDATMYHLPEARAYAESGRIAPDPYLRFAVFPQAVEMLFALGLLFGSDTVPTLINLAMLVLTALVIAITGRRFGTWQGGLWGALLYAASPDVLWQTTVANVDLGVGLFAAAALYSLLCWREGRRTGDLVLAGVFSGLAASVKYNGLFFPIALAVVVVVAAAAAPRSRVRATLQFALAALLGGGAWYAYNAWHTGNPVFPFLGRVFGWTSWSPEDLARQMAAQDHGQARSLARLLSAWWELVAHPRAYELNARLHPGLVAAWPLAILAAWRRPVWRAPSAVFVAWYLAWYATSQNARYLIPGLPFVCAPAGEGLAIAATAVPASARLLGTAGAWAVALVLSLPAYAFACPMIAARGLPPATAAARERYLTAELPSYAAWQAVNAVIGKEQVVCNLYDAQMAYFARGRFRGDWFGPARYERLERTLDSARELHRVLRAEYRADFLVVRREFMPNGRSLPVDEFFRSHFHVLHASPRAVAFRLVDAGAPRLQADLIVNGGFERLAADGVPEGWSARGHAVVDATGREASGGRVAVRTRRDADVLWQDVVLGADRLHVLALHGRAAAGNREITVQVLWRDGSGDVLRRDQETVIGGPGWLHHEVDLTAPPSAQRARVFLGSEWSDGIWWDDVSLRPVIYP